MVGLEVTPTTAASRVRRSRSPSLSRGRERKSIQTLWPWAESWWRGDAAIGDLLRSGALTQATRPAAGLRGSIPRGELRPADRARPAGGGVRRRVVRPRREGTESKGRGAGG